MGSLRANLARITLELEQHKALVVELRQADFSGHKNRDHSFSDPSMNQQIAALPQEIERLTEEIARLGCVVAEGIEVRRRTRGESTMNMEKAEMERLVKKVMEETSDFQRVKADVEKRKTAVDRSGKHELPIRIPLEPVNALFTSIPQSQDSNLVMAYNRSHSSPETSSPSHAKQHEPIQPLLLDLKKPSTPSTSHRRRQGKEESSTSSRSKPRSSSKTLDRSPHSPFPRIAGEDLEREFFSPSPKGILRMKKKAEIMQATDEMDPGKLAPQTVLARVIAELEGDFRHYKMYVHHMEDHWKILMQYAGSTLS